MCSIMISVCWRSYTHIPITIIRIMAAVYNGVHINVHIHNHIYIDMYILAGKHYIPNPSVHTLLYTSTDLFPLYKAAQPSLLMSPVDSTAPLSGHH